MFNKLEIIGKYALKEKRQVNFASLSNARRYANQELSDYYHRITVTLRSLNLNSNHQWFLQLLRVPQTSFGQFQLS